MSGKDRLKQIRSALGLSQVQLSAQTGISSHTINNVEGGYQKLSVRIAVELQKSIVQSSDGNLRVVSEKEPAKNNDARLRIDWLVTGEGEPFETTLKMPSNISITCGEEIITLPKNKNILFYKITDDSMEPDFSPQEIIAVDSDYDNFKSGDFLLLEFCGEIIFRKIYKTEENKVRLVALNEKNVPAIETDYDNIIVKGKWVYKLTLPQY